MEKISSDENEELLSDSTVDLDEEMKEIVPQTRKRNNFQILCVKNKRNKTQKICNRCKLFCYGQCTLNIRKCEQIIFKTCVNNDNT